LGFPAFYSKVESPFARRYEATSSEREVLIDGPMGDVFDGVFTFGEWAYPMRLFNERHFHPKVPTEKLFMLHQTRHCGNFAYSC